MTNTRVYIAAITQLTLGVRAKEALCIRCAHIMSLVGCGLCSLPLHFTHRYIHSHSRRHDSHHHTIQPRFRRVEPIKVTFPHLDLMCPFKPEEKRGTSQHCGRFPDYSVSKMVLFAYCQSQVDQGVGYLRREINVDTPGDLCQRRMS